MYIPRTMSALDIVEAVGSSRNTGSGSSTLYAWDDPMVEGDAEVGNVIAGRRRHRVACDAKAQRSDVVRRQSRAVVMVCDATVRE